MLWGLLALFIGQIFGNTIVPIGTKISVDFTAPLLFVFLRFIISTVLLFILFLFSAKRKIKIRDYKDFALLGFLLAINVIFFSFGITSTTVIMGTLIYSLTPVLVGVAGHFFLHEPLNKQKILGLVIAFIGLLFLVSQSVSRYQANAFGEPLGNILIVIAMLGYSYYVFQSRRVLHIKNHLPLQTTFLTFIFTTLCIFIVLAIGYLLGFVRISPLSHEGSIGFLLVGFGSVAQYLLLQIGVKKTNAFTASLFQYIAPFIAAAAAIPLLHEQITWQLIVGGLLILSGVFIATTYNEVKKRVLKKSA